MTQPVEEIAVMDYVLKSFTGLKIYFFVPNALECGYSARDTELDFKHMTTFVKTSTNDEDRYFNVSATISRSLPDAIYQCYSFPIVFTDTY